MNQAQRQEIQPNDNISNTAAVTTPTQGQCNEPHRNHQWPQPAQMRTRPPISRGVQAARSHLSRIWGGINTGGGLASASRKQTQ